MSQYHSNMLRDLAKFLDSEDETPVINVRRIWARIVSDSADRIDELQKQLGARIEQTARLQDEIYKLKNPPVSTYKAETDGQRARRLLARKPFVIWMGKTLDEMTDDECYECLRTVQETTGVYYI